MRLITVLIEPSLPHTSAERLTSVLKRAGVEAEYVYVDVADAVTRLGLFVRCQTPELERMAEAVVAALAPLAGDDRLVQAQTHSWAAAPGEGTTWW